MSSRRSVINFETRTIEKVQTTHYPVCDMSSSEPCIIVRKQLYRRRRFKILQVSSYRSSILLQPLNELLVSPMTLVLLKIMDVSSR